MAQLVKDLPAMWETWIQSLDWQDPLEKGPEIPPSSRDEGLRLLHGLETNLVTSLQTPQEA